MRRRDLDDIGWLYAIGKEIMVYTISEFWEPKLESVQRVNHCLVEGWESVADTLDGFVEAPLRLNCDLSLRDDSGIEEIILVSAPGAVGKTTLARHIACVTGAIYIDLAKARVGDHTLSGGLVQSDMFEAWKTKCTTAVIDGLDEARFRVPLQSFEAFLADVVRLSQNRGLPTVLFGRTGAIQDTHVILDDIGVKFSVLEIGYFDPKKSVEFVENILEIEGHHQDHPSVLRCAVQLILEQVRGQTRHDGDRFAGYAPVLATIANVIKSYGNVHELVTELKRGGPSITLRQVVRDIQGRESEKLRSHLRERLQDKSLAHKLYLHEEHLDHLVSRVYGTRKADLPDMVPADIEMYRGILDSWVPNHPFLDGDHASTAVFDAVIGVHALQKPESSKPALDRELNRDGSSNPFLSEFYPASSDDELVHLPSEQIGIIYASHQARLAIGDSANLLVEEKEDDPDGLYSLVEISIFRGDMEKPVEVFSYESDQTGEIQLGSRVEDVEINATSVDVCVGGASEVGFFAPVEITCARLRVDANRVIVDVNTTDAGRVGVEGRHGNSPVDSIPASVVLTATEYSGSPTLLVPEERHNAKLLVSWPDTTSYPWTNFAMAAPSASGDPDVDEALRRFRKFVMTFRSHKKGGLARYREKVEHRRMTKGSGRRVLDYMIERRIVYLIGAMYHLNPDRLFYESGVNYGNCVRREFGDKARKFVARAMNNGG